MPVSEGYDYIIPGCNSRIHIKYILLKANHRPIQLFKAMLHLKGPFQVKGLSRRIRLQILAAKSNGATLYQVS